MKSLVLSAAALLFSLGASAAPPQLNATFLEYSRAWGSAVADYNGDGHDDIFITGHDHNDRIWYWTPKGYVPSKQVLKYSDRHDCDAADVNQDGRMDFYCAVGGDKGGGGGRKELWMQRRDGYFVKAENHGAEDQYSSGRYPIFFDLNRDGYPDLFLTSTPRFRPDGQLSMNKVFLNRRGTEFVEVPTIATGMNGWGCVAKGDINGDGWDDLVLCNHEGPAHIYINNHHNDFVELETPALSVWTDAKLADMNNDGLLDLVVLTEKNKLQIWLNTGEGVYFDTPAVEDNFTPINASALAIGDFNGDGRADVYVVLKQKGCVQGSEVQMQDLVPDVVFVSQTVRGKWNRVQHEQRFGGCGHGAAVVDGNKVLLLNGGDQYAGPNYLLSAE